MPSYLRTIVKRRWDTAPDVPWLRPNELKADAFRDLATSDGRLSIWELSEEVEANRVVATRETLGVVDYVVFDGNELQFAGFSVEKSDGVTPDERINGFHYDIALLTTHRLVALADLLAKGEKGRLPQKFIREALQDGLDSGRLNRQTFNPKLLERLIGA